MNRYLLIAVTFVVALAAQADGPGLSLRIADETAPAGSIVQIKIEVTEPKPISTGRGKIKVRGVTTVAGIVLMNEGQDTYGVAMVDGDELSFDITSPSSVFGTPADYPIVGIAGTVASNASNGSTFSLTFDPAGLGFHDPSGATYPTEIQNGQLTVTSGAIAIGNVSPGSAVVPAGGVVRISGANFTPNTRLQLNEVAIAEQRFINSGRIDVVLAQSARMHGMRIRARNEGKNGELRSESEYFAYERTTAIGSSNDAILAKTVPLFAPAAYLDATVNFPRRAGGKHRAVGPSRGTGAGNSRFGIALQNLQSSTATVSIELLDFAGRPYAVNTVTIGSDQHSVREVEELFGLVATPRAFRVRSNIPIHVLGLTADPATGTAAALPPL
ncbi:MAG TPA: hypothetical protein VF608_09040 [Thermoanaerobaculia bacterium]